MKNGPEKDLFDHYAARLRWPFAVREVEEKKKLPPNQLKDREAELLLGVIPENAWIVTYCDGETCSLSEDLAKGLIAMGYQNVRVLPNGLTRWMEAGLPVERGDEGRRTDGTDKDGSSS